MLPKRAFHRRLYSTPRWARELGIALAWLFLVMLHFADDLKTRHSGRTMVDLG